MWVLVMFDLPVGSKAERKRASDFRFALKDEGFEMAQWSVYVRFCLGTTQAETIARRVEAALPEGGHVKIIQFTDRQYARVQSFVGSARSPSSPPPAQYVLFQ